MIKKSGEIQIIDFGFSEMLPKPVTETFHFCGTPLYLPPEFIRQVPYTGIL
jgi:serine/threonine protein kinase